MLESNKTLKTPWSLLLNVYHFECKVSRGFYLSCPVYLGAGMSKLWEDTNA